MEKTKQYLNLNANELTVGELYFVEIKNILGIELQPTKVVDFEINLVDKVCKYQDVYDLDKFQHVFYRKEEYLFEFNNKIDCGIKNDFVLLRYLGDSQFVEYYTGLNIGYQDFTREKIGYEDCFEFMEAYNKNCKSPLYIGKGSLFNLTSKNKLCFYSQNERKEQIKTLLLEANKRCFENLEAKKIEIMKQDERFAYAEEGIRNFQKSLIPKPNDNA